MKSLLIVLLTSNIFLSLASIYYLLVPPTTNITEFTKHDKELAIKMGLVYPEPPPKVIFIKTETGIEEVAEEEINIEALVRNITTQYDVPYELVMAMIETESTFNPYAVNNGHHGLMQISERWHRERMEKLGVTDLYNAESNILVGVDYLAELYELADYDWSLALMLYSGNHDYAYSNHEQGKITSYVIKVYERMDKYGSKPENTA